MRSGIQKEEKTRGTASFDNWCCSNSFDDCRTTSKKPGGNQQSFKH